MSQPPTWKDLYTPVRHMTEATLIAAMAQIPETIRLKLAEGPHPRRWTCAICLAFGKDWYLTAVPAPDDPMWLVFAYHEIPKIHMKRDDDQWYGTLANRTYERGIATYRAAGWKGEAEGANA